MRILVLFFLLFSIFVKAETINLRVVPFNSSSSVKSYSLPRTVEGSRILIYSKYQNDSSSNTFEVSIPFKGLGQNGVNYFYYMEIYYGGPSSSSHQNIFLGSNYNSACGSVTKGRWSVSPYDFTYSPSNVTLRYTGGIAIIYVWEVAVPENVSPQGDPPNDGANGEYGAVIIPDPTSSNPNPLPTVSNPPDGSTLPERPPDTPTDPENPEDPEDPEEPDEPGEENKGPYDVNVINTPNVRVINKDDFVDYQKIPGSSEKPAVIKPWIELPPPPEDPPDPSFNNPLASATDKLHPDISVPSPSTFVFPSWTIPIASGRSVVISLDSGLISHPDIRSGYNLLRNLVRSIAYVLITIVTLKYTLKLFRKNS